MARGQDEKKGDDEEEDELMADTSAMGLKYTSIPSLLIKHLANSSSSSNVCSPPYCITISFSLLMMMFCQMEIYTTSWDSPCCDASSSVEVVTAFSTSVGLAMDDDELVYRGCM